MWIIQGYMSFVGVFISFAVIALGVSMTESCLRTSSALRLTV
jgi:hypothetical protein